MNDGANCASGSHSENNGTPQSSTGPVNVYNFYKCKVEHVGDNIEPGHPTGDRATQSTGNSAGICGSTDHSRIDMMKSLLKDRAEHESKRMTIPIKPNLKINTVSLRLTTKVERNLENLDGDDGHYNKRSDFKKIMKPVEGGIELCEIFEHTAAEAQNRFSEDEMEERHGNTVALIGQAGIGKTTLARKMLWFILHKEVLPETQFFFYIPFRQVNFKEETTLLQFVLTGCTGWMHDDNQDKKLLQVLQESPNVVFIFDGLDEADTSRLSNTTPHCNLYSSQKPDWLLARILTGDFFPKAKKLITSRPRQLFELHPDHRPSFIVDILGLDKTAQQNICRQICGNFTSEVMNYLDLHQDISASCYVPVNCIITMSTLYDRLIKRGRVDVLSLTDIFVQSLDDFVRSEHVREKKDEVWKLGQLAWNGFSTKKIVFDEIDISNAEIDEKAFQAFLCTYVTGEVRNTILQGDKKSSFSHLTWQELFVAVHIMVSEPLELLKDLIHDNKIRKPLWEVVSKFMLGLCNPRVTKRLETVLKPTVPVSWNSKKDALYQSIRQSLESSLQSAELFRLFSWIREANDDKLNEKILDVFPMLMNFDGQVFPTDIVNVTYFMKYAEKSWSIRFGGKTNIDQDSFHLLCKQISSFPHKVQKFSLLFKTIPGAAASLTECVDKIEELYLCYCGMKSPDVEALANKIVNFPQPASYLKKLDLSFNKIGNDGLASIARCLGKISELHLRRCGLTSTDVGALKDNLTRESVAPVRMTLLDLSGNDICDGGQCFLSDYLQHFEKLELRNIGITDAGVKAMAAKVVKLKQPMKLLDLSENNLGDAAARSLAACIKNIDKLDLSYCYIGKSGVDVINRSQASLPPPKPQVTGLLDQGKIKIEFVGSPDRSDGGNA